MINLVLPWSLSTRDVGVVLDTHGNPVAAFEDPQRAEAVVEWSCLAKEYNFAEVVAERNALLARVHDEEEAVAALQARLDKSRAAVDA